MVQPLKISLTFKPAGLKVLAINDHWGNEILNLNANNLKLLNNLIRFVFGVEIVQTKKPLSGL